MKNLIIIFTFFYCGTQFSQELNLDKYKYIIVLEKFDFLSEKNQYQTSSLTKFLLKKKGFEVFLSNETDQFPEDLKENRCLALTAIVKEEPNMFVIKNAIEIQDCFGKVVYKSKPGKTKIKEYKRGYQVAIKNAFETMKDFNYSYKSNKGEFVQKEKIEDKVVEKDVTKVIEKPKISVKKEIIKTKAEVSKSLEILYAQPKNNGFQLVNTKPELVFVVLKTSQDNYFIIKNKNGVLYKKDSHWIAEYYSEGKLQSKKYQVKF